MLDGTASAMQAPTQSTQRDAPPNRKALVPTTDMEWPDRLLGAVPPHVGDDHFNSAVVSCCCAWGHGQRSSHVSVGTVGRRHGTMCVEVRCGHQHAERRPCTYACTGAWQRGMRRHIAWGGPWSRRGRAGCGANTCTHCLGTAHAAADPARHGEATHQHCDWGMCTHTISVCAVCTVCARALVQVPERCSPEAGSVLPVGAASTVATTGEFWTSRAEVVPLGCCQHAGGTTSRVLGRHPVCRLSSSSTPPARWLGAGCLRPGGMRSGPRRRRGGSRATCMHSRFSSLPGLIQN